MCKSLRAINLRNPLNTSPSASARVFPCSTVMDLASSFWNMRWAPRQFVSALCSCLVVFFNIWKNTNIKCSNRFREPKDWFCSNQGQIVQYSIQLHLHLILPDPLTYNVIFDHLLIAQEDLLPSQDGSLWPGAKGSWAWVDGSRHLLLGGFGYTVDHLISSLQAK